MNTGERRREDIVGQWMIRTIVVVIIICLLLPSLSYMSGGVARENISGVGALEFTSSNGYLGTNDSGPQWSPEVCLTNSSSNSTMPSIAVDSSGRLHMVWIDDGLNNQIDGAWNGYGGVIYYKSSDDGAINWSTASTPILDNGHVGSYNVELAQLHYNPVADSLALYMVEFTTRRGPIGVVSYSYDHGNIWSDSYFATGDVFYPVTVTRDVVASTGNDTLFSSWYSGAALEGGFYRCNITGTSIPSIASGSGNFYAMIPTAEGLNFSMENTETGICTTPVQITNLTSTTTALSADGDNLYLVWSYDVNGTTQLYFKTSHDAGATWSEDTKITDSAGTADHADISIDKDRVNIVWQDHSTGNWQVHYMQLGAAGGVLINDTKLSNSTGDAMYPQIVTDANGYSYVVWQDSRNGKWDIYMRKNPDRDVTPPEITHEPVETIGGMENLTINASVSDNFGVKYVSVRYWGDRATSPSIKEMTLTSGDIKNGTWETEISPSEMHSRNIYYYIQAADSDNVVVTQIYHVVVNGCSPHFDNIGNYSAVVTGDREINISISDPLGVDGAILYYSVNGSEYEAQNMTLSAGDSINGIWSSVISGLPAGSTVSFYVEAESGDTTNSTDVFTFTTEKNSVNNNPADTSDDSDTSMAGNPAESGGVGAVLYGNLLPIIAVIVSAALIGALLYAKRCKKNNEKEKEDK